jgi:hypothetical protein
MKRICVPILRSVRAPQSVTFRKATALPSVATNYSPFPRHFSTISDTGRDKGYMAPKFELKTPKGTKDCEYMRDEVPNLGRSTRT